MKKVLFFLMLLGFLCILNGNPNDQERNWQLLPTYGGTPVSGPVSFSLGDHAYVVSGTPGYGDPFHEVWELDSINMTWQRKADFPGTPTLDGLGFTIGNKGYTCTGITNTAAPATPELWEYDNTTDSWLRKADFPGTPGGGKSAFVFSSSVYIVGGNAENEVWQYTPATDIWTAKANFPGLARFMGSAFVVGEKGYYFTGISTGDSTSIFYNDVWEYTPQTDSWIQKLDFPGDPRGYSIGYGVSGFGYLTQGFAGMNPNDNTLLLLNDFWKYNPISDEWIQLSNFPGQARSMCTGFTIGYTIYLGQGDNYFYQKIGDFWKCDVTISNTDFTQISKPNLLQQNYPNPFNPSTQIAYTNPATQHVSLNIYNNKGQLVRTLVEELQSAGTHYITWNGLNNSQKSVTSGIYYYKMTAGNRSEMRKMVICK